jgi:hypothetical protein
MNVSDLTPQEQARCALAAQGIICAWLLESHQLEVYEQFLNLSTSEDILLFCARRWGKSVLSLAFAVEYCLNNPKTIVRMAAPTLTQAYEIANDILEPLIIPYMGKLLKKAKSDLRWTFSNGSSLRLGTVERAHVNTLRGGGNAHLIITEECAVAAKSDDFQYAYQSVLGPQLLRTKGRFIHVTTPSDQPDHYIHTNILPQAEQAGTLFVRDIYTNTSLDKDQIATEIKRCGGESSDTWQREYLCKVVKSQITALFPTDITATPFTLPTHYNALVAIDTGGVKDKTVALLFAYDFLKAKTLVVDEICFPPNTSTATIMEAIKVWEQPYLQNIRNRFCDGSGQLLIDLATTHQYPVTLPPKQDWLASLNSLRVAVEAGNILIHPRCTLLLATIRNGRLTKNKQDFERTEALGHCDAVAAAMYGFRCMYSYISLNPYPNIYNPNIWAGSNTKQEKEALVNLARALTPTHKRK